MDGLPVELERQNDVSGKLVLWHDFKWMEKRNLDQYGLQHSEACPVRRSPLSSESGKTDYIKETTSGYLSLGPEPQEGLKSFISHL